MQREEDVKSANMSQWKRPGFIYKFVLGLFAMVTILGVFFIALKDSKRPENNNVTEVDQNYINFSDEAKSSVCESLPADKIGQAIGNEIGDTQRLLPDTTVNGGSVAGCKYTTVVRTGQKVQSVSIVTQHFDDEAQAAALYDVMAAGGKVINGLTGNASYLSAENPQLVIRIANKIAIITGVTASREVTDLEAELSAVAKLI